MYKILGDPNKAERQKFTMTADQVAGDIVVENGMVGILIDDALDTTEGVAYVKTDEKGAGPFPKADVAIDRFDTAYYDTGAGAFTNVVGSNIRVGYFSVASLQAPTTITGVVLTGQVGS